MLTSLVLLVALFATACGGSDPAPGADRAVGSGADDADWERDAAIQRTVLIEAAMDSGLTRTESACIIDAVVAPTSDDGGDADGWTLDDLVDVDLSAQTSSNASDDLAAELADALIDCGPALNPHLDADIPGALSIPDTHLAEYDCVVASYIDAWRDAATNRFDGGRIDEPTPIDVSNRTVSIVAGCDAGGAVILGASNEGNLDTHALNTLGWTCLDNRLDPDQFMPAFPFPDEPGDALDRLGSSVLADATYCEEFSSPGGIDN
ncbi:MAG: hypothetical protein R8F63_12050 [Acidimicrobiales bacterium]|nr:hypothetical protein [Acidimicrobiales bacterium]